MKRRLVEIWRRRNKKVGEEKEKERETGWLERKRIEKKKIFF